MLTINSLFQINKPKNDETFPGAGVPSKSLKRQASGEVPTGHVQDIDVTWTSNGLYDRAAYGILDNNKTQV